MEVAVTVLIAAFSGLGVQLGRLNSRIHELDRRLDGIEVKVAENYVTKSDMSEILNRVTDHMVRIEDKLDNLQQTIKYN